ncbi:hypothetical protein ACN6KF_001483 [Labrys sp. La1]|uniref:hypothetical protein n=1 Tax=Labrys sp. La1 TaxID=3404917 RepID=UPI003EB8030D
MSDREALIQKLRDLFYSYQDSSDGDALEEAIEILSAPALASQEGAQAGEVDADRSLLLRQLKSCVDKPMRNMETFPYICRRAYEALTTPPAPDDAVRAVVLQEVLGCRTFNDRGEYAGWNITKLNRLVGNDGRFPVGR